MTVFTIVTEETKDSALPSSVNTGEGPAVENTTPELAIIVPTIVPPPAALIIAVEPTCQKMFFGWALPARIML
jgi:hypothetical protein